MHRLSMNCFDGDQFIDIGFAVFSPLHGLLLACSRGC